MSKVPRHAKDLHRRGHKAGCERRRMDDVTALVDDPSCTCGLLEARRAAKSRALKTSTDFSRKVASGTTEGVDWEVHALEQPETYREEMRFLEVWTDGVKVCTVQKRDLSVASEALASAFRMEKGRK